MATVSKWTPFGVALDITATGSNVKRTSATKFTVTITASWETYYEGAKTKYGMTASSGGGSVTLKTFNNTAASGGTGIFTGTYSISGNGAATKTITVTFRNFNNDNGDSATKTVSFNVSVPALRSYTVKYNANGGTGAPSSQTKWEGQSLTLSATKPTRTGYTFQGWDGREIGASVVFSPGAYYNYDASATLYAMWKANTYTVTYNANGGTGAPAAQTKTYGQALTLSSTKPTRANYNFLGWGVASNAIVSVYSPGSSYTQNAAITLYAVWELAYVKPRIVNLSLSRCDADGTLSDEGTCALVSFDFECDRENPTIKIEWALVGEAISGNSTFSSTVTNASVSYVVGSGAFSTESSYDIYVTVTDSDGSTSIDGTLSSMKYTIDYLAGGNGVAFGKAAELEDTAEFEFGAQFNGPVRGNALGMNRLPEIPANSDFNNYMETGCYAVYRNDTAATIANIPVARAGRLEVWSSTGEGIRSEQWSYLRQRFVPYNQSNAVWERDVSRNDDNVWTYYDWYRTSLTPSASEKVYAKAAMTLALSANKTLGTVNAYITIPLDKNVLSTSGRLTLSDNSIRIGSNIQHVRVSGVVLLKCGSSTGNRHVRIQKISNGVTTSYSWACVYGVAASNTEYVLPPMIIPVAEGDLIRMVYYTSDSADMIASGSAANGWQTYLTVEEL